MILRLIILIIVTTLNVGLAGTTDPNIPDKKYIAYGQEFESVGKICGSYKNGTKFCASAVAIDEHHVLTAAHVVKDSVSCSVFFKGKEFCLDSMVVHKDFDEDKFGVADIAIGYSGESFNLESYPTLYETNDEIEKLCSISGYGFYGTFISGAKKYDDKRRAGLNRIEEILIDMLICNASKNSDKNKTELEFLIASGDSGGGLFIDGRLAGINSCIMSVDKSPSAKYNEESGHTRISKFISWINENKKK